MKGFARFRANLRLRFFINGTPLHYGRLLVAWNPRYGIRADSAQLTVPSSQFQRPVTAMLDPCKSYSEEIVLPYLYEQPMLAINGDGPTSTPFADMGKLAVVTFSPLRHANLATAPTINIAVYAWFEDYVLSLPSAGTFTLAGPKSEKDGKGPISSVASAFANAGNALSDVPVIGAFAKAGAAIAGTISSIASVFGFSRPRDITSYVYNRPAYAGNMANAIAADQSKSMALDERQGLVVDPSVVGLGSEDQMSIAYISTRWGMGAAVTTWDTSTAQGTKLMVIPVNPLLVPSNGTPYQPTPLAFVSLPFDYWSGTLEYRIVVSCTQYHSGRLLIRYIPSAVTVGTDDGITAPTALSCIMDLSVETTLDFTIGWGNASMALRTGSFLYPGGTFANTSCNGRFDVSVLSELVGMVATTTVDIMLFVRAGDDFQLLVPGGINANNFTMTGPRDVTVPRKCVLSSPIYQNDNLSKVAFGERVASIRPLIKKYQLVMHANPVTGGTVNAYVWWKLVLDTTPVNISNASTNVGIWGSLPGYFAGGFLGVRGGMRYKMDGAYPFDTINDVTASTTRITCQYVWRPNSLLTWGASVGAIGGIIDFQDSSLINGTVLGWPDPLRSGLLEFEVPDYSNNLFRSAFISGTITTLHNNGYETYPSQVQVFTAFHIGSTTSDTDVRIFAACAEDFQYVQFMGAPLLT